MFWSPLFFLAAGHLFGAALLCACRGFFGCARLARFRRRGFLTDRSLFVGDFCRLLRSLAWFRAHCFGFFARWLWSFYSPDGPNLSWLSFMLQCCDFLWLFAPAM